MPRSDSTRKCRNVLYAFVREGIILSNEFVSGFVWLSLVTWTSRVRNLAAWCVANILVGMGLETGIVDVIFLPRKQKEESCIK
jgi:hypothetical protein